MSLPTNKNSESGEHIDKLFRNAMGQQEVNPSPRVWKNLNWKLLIGELVHFNFTNVPKLALVSIAGSILVVASLTYWALQSDNSQTISQLSESPTASVKQPASPENISVKHIVNNVNKNYLIASNVRIEKSAPAAEPEVSTPASSRVINENTSTSLAIKSMDPLMFSNFDLVPESDTLSFIRSGEVFKYAREKMPVPSFFSADLGVAPELALYNSKGASAKEFNYWANVGIAYHYSRFSIHTGLGLGQTSDEGIYKIEYKSNDSVSFYKEVIGYYPDPANPSKIIYITKNHAIYDSVMHIADDRTRDRYTYIQIPLLLGFSVFESSKFCLGIEAGPAVSFLINQKKAQPVIDIPYGKLVKLQDNSPSRLKTTWQLWVKLSVEYQFTKNWGLVINPYYKYYLTSPSQSSETGNRTIQAFGVDVGIQYFFGRKSNKK